MSTTTTTKPASPKQIRLIERLARNHAHGAALIEAAGGIEQLTGGWGGTASTLIDQLTGKASLPALASTKVKAPEFTPTAEQDEAIRLFLSGESFKVYAFAGAGKTSTLKLMADAAPKRKGRFMAFNKNIVEDAKKKMPPNVTVSTAHSLAYGGTPTAFKNRLRNSSRMRGDQIARLLDISPLQVSGKIGDHEFSKTLAPGFLASLALGAVRRFCQSGDREITVRHFAPVPGIDPEGEYTNSNRVALALVDAARRAWQDLTDPNGRLPYNHDYYLKSFELSGPVVPVDFLMVDECQPTGTVVETPGGPRKIEELRAGDRVISYNQSNLNLHVRGSTVEGVSARRFKGDLITVLAGELETQYTPNHHCIARIGPGFYGKSLVYLMRRGTQWRVGTTSANHGKVGGSSGLAGRLREEGGEAAWVLAAFEDKQDALLLEATIVAKYGIPDMRWRCGREGQAAQDKVAAFWAQFPDLNVSATRCLDEHGRDIRYPLVTRSWTEEGARNAYLLYSRASVVRACNLMDGMEVIDSRVVLASRNARGRYAVTRSGPEWVPIKMSSTPYNGYVWSLTVAGDHTYIGDGIVTHNCQDLSGVMLSIVEQQHRRGVQVIAVGDSYQAINQFMGAIDALERLEGVTQSTTLTKSFRFGPKLAEAANDILRVLGAPKDIEGNETVATTIGPLADPTCYLTRTNAAAVRRFLGEVDAGGSPHLVGGGEQVVRFCKAALELQTTGSTSHPDLACFSSWGELQAYVASEEQGEDLKLMVGLIDEFGAERIISALERMPTERKATLIVSTAHKVKGREWDKVQLGGDFPTGTDKEGNPVDPDPHELQLLYVAVTRAKVQVDFTMVGALDAIITTQPDQGDEETA